MQINRILSSLILGNLKDKKAIIVLGPRQVGKTTLINSIIEQDEAKGKKIISWNGDDSAIRAALQNISTGALKALVSGAGLLVIDEAQRIDNIGLLIKIIVDSDWGVKVIATGSSAFELANKMNEPLTGRKWEYMLLPFSYGEMCDHHGLLNERSLLETRLVYGYYPEVVNSMADREMILRSLTDSYLYKDILSYDEIRKPEKLEKLLQALAWQIGNEVSYTELGKLCQLNYDTVEKYINLLEKTFVVFRLSPLSRNLRNELVKTRKIYFYDNGVRNAIIGQLQPVANRNDMGALWENFLVSERIKYIKYHQHYCNRYFWRTQTRQEVDYVEEYDGQIHAYEFKWSKATKAKIPQSFLNAYPGSQSKIITPDNMEEFLLR